MEKIEQKKTQCLPWIFTPTFAIDLGGSAKSFVCEGLGVASNSFVRPSFFSGVVLSPKA